MPKTKQKKIRRISSNCRRLPKGPNGGVQLLLIHSVDQLGHQGDVVEVKAGYAKNYLLPQGLATLATAHHQRMVEKHRAKLLAMEEKHRGNLRDFAAALSKQSVTIEANANDEGHLYGSVVAADIVAALQRAGTSIDQDQVRLQGPLKELGLYTVAVRFAEEIEGELKVWVVPTVGEEGAEPSST